MKLLQSRAVGTNLGKGSAAYGPVMSDKTYIGEAKILNKPYLTGYEPLKDKDGNIIGILFVGIAKAQVDQSFSAYLWSTIQNIVIVSIFIILLILTVSYIFVKRRLMPLKTIQQLMIEAGTGNLTVNVNDKLNSHDEIGLLIDSFNKFIEKIKTMVQSIYNMTAILNNSSESLQNLADTTAANSEETSAKTNGVSKNCDRSKIITDDAEVKVKNTCDIIERLSMLSGKIGKVIGIISDIADQTNMLALNAAIEAASAGEAGKGFAVVSSEVKALARQTGEATEEIRQQIEDMQLSMAGAVNAVGSITRVIKEITSITGTIASAVNEQYVATDTITKAILVVSEESNHISREIAGVADNLREASVNTSEASSGVKQMARSATELSKASVEVADNTEQVNKRVSEVAAAVTGISKEINEISQSAAEINAASVDTASGAMETINSAKSLTEVSIKLKELVSQFKV